MLIGLNIRIFYIRNQYSELVKKHFLAEAVDFGKESVFYKEPRSTSSKDPSPVKGPLFKVYYTFLYIIIYLMFYKGKCYFVFNIMKQNSILSLKSQQSSKLWYKSSAISSKFNKIQSKPLNC